MSKGKKILILLGVAAVVAAIYFVRKGRTAGTGSNAPAGNEPGISLRELLKSMADPAPAMSLRDLLKSKADPTPPPVISLRDSLKAAADPQPTMTFGQRLKAAADK